MGTGNSKLVYRHGEFLVRAFFLICMWLSSSCILTCLREREREILMIPPNPDYFPKAPFSDTITLEIKASTYKFCENTNSVHSTIQIGDWVNSQGYNRASYRLSIPNQEEFVPYSSCSIHTCWINWKMNTCWSLPLDLSFQHHVT